MARPSSPPILTQIRNSRSSAEQIVALRALKNDIIGHQQKKEMWVGLGVVDPIVRIISSNKAQGKQSNNEGRDKSISFEPLSKKEMVRLQALCVIGSLAYGGPGFLAPLHSASILPAILSNLCPISNPPQLVLSALRALCNITDSIRLASTTHTLKLSTLADSLFSRPHVGSLFKILLQHSSTSIAQSQISLTASLISKLSRSERQQVQLARAGILDALGTQLASIVVSQGLVAPGADIVAQKERLAEYLPPPAPHNADLAGLLEAIAAVIADSKFRASQLIYSNAIMAVFPRSTLADVHPSTKAAWSPYSVADLKSLPSALELLIPHMPSSRSKSASVVTSSFPPLGTSGSYEHVGQLRGSRVNSQSRVPTSETGFRSQENATAESNESESPLIPYLIWLTRSSRSLERLMAAYVLTVLYRAGLTDKSREAALGLLVVPVLVQLLKDEKAGLQDYSPVMMPISGRIAVQWKIRELAPAALAMLIVDSEYLQKSAYDSGVVPRLSEMLKAAYEPILEGDQSRTWSPSTAISPESGISCPPHTSPFGVDGQLPLLVHRISMRDSILRAVAALVPFKDEYRKALIDQGIVPYIVESLKAHPNKPSVQINERLEKPSRVSGSEEKLAGLGINPVSVLIAACGAVRHLSRSVSILRTTLIDNGVVMPIFALLQHSDISVQIAATAATCNLVMDFSPMRQTIAAAGVLKILCGHAHSGNVKLRLNALWALKHLVQSAGNDVKKTCLEELGQGWLVQLICDDTEDNAVSSDRSGLGPLTCSEESDDMQMDNLEDENDLKIGDDLGTTSLNYADYDSKQSFSTSRPTSRGESSLIGASRLAALRDLEINPVRRARKDDIAVQEQGLDFIRNLIGGFNNVGTSETSEMIDFLLNALGPDQIFEILASKLRFKVVNPFNKRGSTSSSETRFIPPQAEIIAAVEYILVHMAASVPRHRQLVISQTELLKLLIPHFTHPSKEVRLALCWLVINLTWVDDAHDGQACAQRAQELKKLGFLSRLENLEHDVELDVRERAKTAVWQVKQGY